MVLEPMRHQPIPYQSGEGHRIRPNQIQFFHVYKNSLSIRQVILTSLGDHIRYNEIPTVLNSKKTSKIAIMLFPMALNRVQISFSCHQSISSKKQFLESESESVRIFQTKKNTPIASRISESMIWFLQTPHTQIDTDEILERKSF